jgi:hypothetical protein
MPALHLHLRRNISQSAPGQILPAAYQTLASVQADLQEGFVFFNKADLASAKQIFVQALLSMLLVVVSSDEEAKQVRFIACDSQMSLTLPLVERPHHFGTRISRRRDDRTSQEIVGSRRSRKHAAKS